MDGLSSQNEQEEKAMRAQAQEEQQQAMILQRQIHRYFTRTLGLLQFWDVYICYPAYVCMSGLYYTYTSGFRQKFNSALNRRHFKGSFTEIQV